LRESELSLLYYALWRAAVADHPVNAAEERVLAEIARELHLDPDIEAAMRSAANPSRRRASAPKPPRAEEARRATEPEPEPELRSPYDRLGLKAAASDDEVKRAYRALAQKLHPDKVAHLGSKATETAARAFAEVNLAYEEIRKQRGL
jgi:DnaJ-domain-containing protein 1